MGHGYDAPMARPSATAWGYRTRDAARLLAVPPGRVRAWARLGFADPGRGPRGELIFSFPDLVLLRSARELQAARVPARRIRRALRALRVQLPAGRPLASVRIAADGDCLVVRDGTAAWRPESGQALFEFAVASLSRRVAPLLRQSPPAPARERGSDHPAVRLGLGRMLQEAGDPAGAEDHYRAAAGRLPGDPAPLLLLAGALEEQARPEEALLAYARALEADPERAEAHLGAARLLEALGRTREALRHRAAWRRLSPRGGR